MKTQFRTNAVFLSDIHLGTPNAKVAEVCDFLRSINCRHLILNGDIIDGWALKRGGSWPVEHTSFVRLVFEKMEKEGTQVVYLRGNHDDILERFLPLTFGDLKVVNEYIHESSRGRYLVVHGDGFDQVTTNHRWLAMAGAIGYELLLRLNRFSDRLQRWLGREPFSLSKAVKARVKSAVSFVGNFEELLSQFAKKRQCQGIICGHIHTPADRMIDGVHYLNSGDWVESLTGIIEHLDGRFEVVEYSEFLSRLGTKKQHASAPKEALAKAS